MSNVYKYYAPQEVSEKARSIDSSAAAEEKVKRALAAEEERRRALAAANAMDDEAEDGEEGDEGDFTEGLFAEQVDPESGEIIGEVETGAPEEMPEQEAEPELPPMIAEEAEQILADARAQAEQILADAQAQAEQLVAGASEKGYEEGLANGRAAAEQELSEAMGQLENERANLAAEQEQALKEIEPQLLDVILQVFNKVFHIQFDDKKEILEHLVMNTILNVEGSKEFRIKTSEANAQYLTAHLAEIRSQVGQEYTIEVVTDHTLNENKCVIETDAGLFDCSLGVHLENLIKDLKSLAS